MAFMQKKQSGKVSLAEGMPENLDTKQKLVDWLCLAFDNPHGKEMRQLYNDLFTHFCDADIHMNGTVSRLEFDQLIENSARRIRDLGLLLRAISSIELYRENMMLE